MIRNRIITSFAPSMYADSLRDSGTDSIAVLQMMELYTLSAARKNQCPERIVKTKTSNIQVCRNHTTREEHRKHNQSLNQRLEHNILRCHKISCEQCQQNVDWQRNCQNNQSVLISRQKQRMRKMPSYRHQTSLHAATA